MQDTLNNQKNNMQEGRRSSRRWLFVAVLAVVAACLVVDVGFAVARGPGLSGGDNVLAVAGPLTSDTNGLFLVDLDNETILVYQYSSGKNRLRFSAARTFAYDRLLEDYSTSPSPEQIRRMVERSQGASQAGNQK